MQCEQKNLKTLLNLKDEQLLLYENKTLDLITENEDLTIKQEELKRQAYLLEEENMYIKAVKSAASAETRSLATETYIQVLQQETQTPQQQQQ